MRVEDYRSEEQIQKHIRRQKAEMSRRKWNRGTPPKYRASGGPFDGADLWLRTESTAVVTVGDWHGRYIKAGAAVLVWEKQ